MVPILNHSLFININKRIINVIVEIVKAIGLDITILLCLKVIDLTKLLYLSYILPYIIKSFNEGLILYPDE
jgi:hypothetical protein